MKLVSTILLLFCASAFGQAFTPRRPFVTQSTPASGPSSMGQLAYWWVASDLPLGAVSTWTDRNVGSVWQSRTPAQPAPTNTVDGVQFNGTTHTTLTNVIGAISVITNSSQFVILARTGTGAFQDILDFKNDGTWEWTWFSTTWELFPGSKAAVGNPGTNVFFDMAYTSDYANNRIIGYTNGVAVITNTTSTIGGTWHIMGGITNSGFFSGYIKELIMYTNTVLNLTTVSNLHYYATNTYHYTP